MSAVFAVKRDIDACPKLLQPKGRNSPHSTAPSSSRPPPQVPRPPAAFAAPTAGGVPPSPLFDQFQQFQAFLATQGNHSQASAMTTTLPGLHGSYTTPPHGFLIPVVPII